MLNSRAAQDVRKVLSGKDAGLFNDRGILLATVESFKATVDVKNNSYLPLGEMQERDVPVSFKVTVSFTETVIEDETFISELMDGMATGVMPSWNLQGVVKGRSGDEERMIYRDCVPQGSIDLQNLTVGETLKRAWSMTVNNPPKLQSMLKLA